MKLLENGNEMTDTEKRQEGVDKESDLVGRNTAAWGHKLTSPWLHFRPPLLCDFHPPLLAFVSLCLSVSLPANMFNQYRCYSIFAGRQWRVLLKVLVLSGGADLGRVALSQLVQASGVLQLELGFSTEELLQVLQQLQPRLGLLLQTTELLHQLVTDLCISKRETTFSINRAFMEERAYVLGTGSACQTSHGSSWNPQAFSCGLYTHAMQEQSRHN